MIIQVIRNALKDLKHAECSNLCPFIITDDCKRWADEDTDNELLLCPAEVEMVTETFAQIAMGYDSEEASEVAGDKPEDTIQHVV